MLNHRTRIRRLAGITKTQACVLADVSPVTWRLYEAAPESISPEKRAQCDAALAKIAAVVEQEAAA
jgi:hypothetical protein